MNRKICHGIILSLIILIASCASVNRVSVDANTNSQNSIQIGDVFLSEALKVKDLVVRRNSNGNMIVNVLFENQLYTKVNAQVKIEFFDEDGVKIDDPWGYKPLVIEGQQQEWIKSVSVSPNAARYDISFKTAGGKVE
jgi:uncharacterized protein YcfL